MKSDALIYIELLSLNNKDDQKMLKLKNMSCKKLDMFSFIHIFLRLFFRVNNVILLIWYMTILVTAL